MLFFIFIIALIIVTFYSNFVLGWFAALGTTFFLWAKWCTPGLFFYLSIIFAALVTIVFFVPAIRRKLVSPSIFKILKSMLPTIGETERIALEAGTIWWDKEFFSGKPHWKKMFSFYEKPLSDEERAFLDGPVEELCDMINDWEITQKWNMEDDAWNFIKDNKFFGMIIPKEYGGLGFSARAHSEVVSKLGSRSTSAAVTVMVPNSLGPAELLLHYGTDEQKNYYLPKLATGEEIPCFGLTEPTAGSDAGSMKSTGVIYKETLDGEEVLGIRLNWEKRWITLSPIATVLGLAFVLKDPDHLLGDVDDLGITCALVPTDLSGVNTGRRHNPLHSSFFNGPTWGTDVCIPLDYIIGGQKMAGQGWKMLMESLAAGRSISLPAMSCGNSKLALRTCYTYANIREQFGLPIAKFEGVEEKLAEIVGFTNIIDSARTLTAGAVDAGEHPSVISAVMKAYTTELGRNVINNAMDVRAGSEITLGPKNILGNVYTSMPISITVEGANILTRTLIIYGQGAIRCHPHIQDEIKSIETDDLTLFDRSFFRHVAFTAQNKIRTLVLSISNGYLGKSFGDKHTRQFVRQLSRFSASFSYLSDTCMGILGGTLKRKEKISGRLADALAWMYLTTAVVKRYLDTENNEHLRPIMQWSAQFGLYQIQQALWEVISNLPLKIVRLPLRILLFPWGRTLSLPSDNLGHNAVTALEHQRLFDDLTKDIHLPKDQTIALGLLEKTYAQILKCKDIDEKIKTALRDKKLKKSSTLLQDALNENIISNDEYKELMDREILKLNAIEVDDFEINAFSKS